MASEFLSSISSMSGKFHRIRKVSMGLKGPLPAHTRRRRGAFGAFHFKREKLLKQLETAIDEGDVTAIEEIAEMFSIQELEEDQICYVLKACEKGNLDVLATLLRHGASMNSLGDDNYAPLHIAVKQGSSAMVAMLISAGANVDVHSKYECKTPLQVAVMEGYLTISELLLANGADINNEDLYGGQALHIACRMGKEKMVATLLDHHAKIDCYDKEGWTGLHLASQAGHSNVVKYLVQQHANVDCQSKYGRTSLHWACASGHVAVVNELIHGGANANIRDLHDKLALDYAQNETIRTLVKIYTDKSGIAKMFLSTIGICIQSDPLLQNQDNDVEKTEVVKTTTWLSAECVTDSSQINRLSGADFQVMQKSQRVCERQKNVPTMTYEPEGNTKSYSNKDTEEVDVISNTFRHLVHSMGGAIASLTDSFRDLHSVIMAIASEPKIKISHEAINNAAVRLSSVQQELKNFERNFQVESDNFLSVVQREKTRLSASSGAPAFAALVAMFTESLLDVVSKHSDPDVWKSFMKAMELEQEIKALLTIRLQLDHESSVRDKLKHCIMFWARSIEVDGSKPVKYMKTLLQAVQICSGSDRTGEDEMITDILQNFITIDRKFRTGTLTDKTTNLCRLVQLLQEKETQMLLHSLDGCPLKLNLFAEVGQLSTKEYMVSGISQMTEETEKRKRREDKENLYQKLKDIIEQEDIYLLILVVKFLILCGNEDLIVFVL